MHKYFQAFADHEDEAAQAFIALRKMTTKRLPRVPGMDTLIRLAWRIECGRSVQEAAAREYMYRWNLALKSPIFGVPHSLGL